jgi:hypothetical protein
MQEATMSDYEEEIKALVEEGIFTPTGKGGYSVDWELFHARHPELAAEMWEDHLAETDAAIDNLLELGLIKAELGDDLEWVYSITEAGKRALGGQ